MSLTYESDEQKWTIIKKAIEEHMPANKIFGFEIIELEEGYAKFMFRLKMNSLAISFKDFGMVEL